MSIADRISTIANNLIRILNKGKEQRDYEWWDTYQTNLGSIDCMYAFAGCGWRDNVYNPIRAISGNLRSDDMYAYSGITDTKVPIDLSNNTGGSKATKTFRNSELITIRKLIVSETTSMSSQFTNCECLENLTIEGTIGTDANFQWCEYLTLESMISIINALKNFTLDDPDNEFTCTVQFSDESLDILKSNYADDIETVSWFDVITYKGWNI